LQGSLVDLRRLDPNADTAAEEKVETIEAVARADPLISPRSTPPDLYLARLYIVCF
jgi:hypothetical protein